MMAVVMMMMMMIMLIIIIIIIIIMTDAGYEEIWGCGAVPHPFFTSALDSCD
jgi:hypothetical protein